MPKKTPHGLGRIYVPDARDWQMGEALDRLSAMTPLQEANAKLQASKSVAKATKEWAALVTQALAGTPTPDPTPVPTPTPDPNPTAKVWDDEYFLDQGQTGHCVGFSWAGWMGCEPIEDKVTNQTGHDIYYACKVIDGEPNAEDGSTVRSGAKVMQNQKRLTNYVFTTKIDDVKTWLLTQGPVVFGTNWYNNMFDPDTKGVVVPGGTLAGGHAYLGIGYDKSTDMIMCHNSWGKAWGIGGNFYIAAKDMATLLSRQGECCAATEVFVA